MELFDVMRTTFAAREFTDEPVPDATLFTILDRARFAPSGGNRQGWHVIVVRDRATRQALSALNAPAGRRYAAQLAPREKPWHTVDATAVDADTIARTPLPARPPPPREQAAPAAKEASTLREVSAGALVAWGGGRGGGPPGPPPTNIRGEARSRRRRRRACRRRRSA